VEPAALRALVAKNVRAAAKRNGVALTALADFAAVSRSQLFAVLAADTSPTLDWIAKIAAALDIEPWQLLAPRTMKRETR
jgi:lambda repressor-like predicted transcriptional regulator